MNPPSAGEKGQCRVTVRQLDEETGISTVDYTPRFPFRIRFHARGLYDFLMRIQIRVLCRHLPEIDVVWCFDFNLFSDLRQFGARYRIFHPVDPVSYPYQGKPARSANLALSVSEQILNHVRPFAGTARCEVVNHGLARCFVAREALENDSADVDRPRVGYSGNLLRPQINHAVIRRIVSENPNVEFVFWGNCDISPSDHDDTIKFIEFLRSVENVDLRGAVSVEILAREMQVVDGFLLSYRADGKETDNSNSHKLLEYLSAGKVVISNPIGFYKDRPDLVEMASTDDEVVALFSEVTANLLRFNAPERQAARRDFAVANTYSSHLARIGKILGD